MKITPRSFVSVASFYFIYVCASSRCSENNRTRETRFLRTHILMCAHVVAHFYMSRRNVPCFEKDFPLEKDSNFSILDRSYVYVAAYCCNIADNVNTIALISGCYFRAGYLRNCSCEFAPARKIAPNARLRTSRLISIITRFFD